jgi:hypothetical protein
MPEHEFRLTGLLQTLENDTFLAEALLYPEVLCLGDDRDELCLALEANARHLVCALPPLDLYRRHQTGPVEIAELPLTLDAPARSASWREPVELTLPVL